MRSEPLDRLRSPGRRPLCVYDPGSARFLNDSRPDVRGCGIILSLFAWSGFPFHRGGATEFRN